MRLSGDRGNEEAGVLGVFAYACIDVVKVKLQTMGIDTYSKEARKVSYGHRHQYVKPHLRKLDAVSADTTHFLIHMDEKNHIIKPYRGPMQAEGAS